MTEQTTPTKKKRFPAWLLLLIGIGLAILYWTVIAPAMEQRKRFAESYAVSAEQMRAVGKAIAKYETANGERPMKLAELVEAKLIEPAVLFDEQRGSVPVTIEKFAEFDTNPDVLYFPALRASDPPDNVLICTLLLRNKRDKYRVIYNDGRLGQLEPMELVIALNRTYEYIGMQLNKTAKEGE